MFTFILRKPSILVVDDHSRISSMQLARPLYEVVVETISGKEKRHGAAATMLPKKLMSHPTATACHS